MKGKPKDKSNLDALQYRQATTKQATTKQATTKDGPSSETILRELILLAGEKTDPANPDAERDKDINSFKAFRLAGQLIGPLLKWAINHETGKIIEDHKSTIAMAPHRTRSERLFNETKQRNQLANSHLNETIGDAYAGDDPVINRKCTAKVLEFLANAMDFGAGVSVGIALEALDSGQTLPELQPAKNKRQGPSFWLDRSKLSAIQHVEFRHGAGILKHKAIEIVAASFGVGEDVIPQWQKSSASRLASIDPAMVVDFANNARVIGAVSIALDDKSKRAKLPAFSPPIDWDDPTTTDRLREIVDRFSDKNLKMAGIKYKTLVRS